MELVVSRCPPHRRTGESPATAEEMSFSAPLADDMSLLVENLRKYRPQGQISSD